MPHSKYMLITVINRSISTHLFSTHQDAANAMHAEMVDYGGIEKEIFDGGWGQTYDGEYFFVGTWGGYVNLDKYDMDWSIVKVVCS